MAYETKLWPKGCKIKVAFPRDDVARDAWKIEDDGRKVVIQPSHILKIANEWHQAAPDVVPEFIVVPKNGQSDIRVAYISKNTMHAFCNIP